MFPFAPRHEAPLRRRQDRALAWSIVLAGILLVGAFDYATGIEIRVFPLYFFPLAVAARRFGIRSAVAAALLVACTWMAMLYLNGVRYSSPWIWGINFLTQGSAFVLFAVLIASLQQHLRREHELSRTDPLTGLTNSRAFLERGPKMLAASNQRGEPITLAFIDLDHFKRVNDRDGHEAGDRLLETVGALLRRHLGEHGEVARLGGDEFAVLLPAADAPRAQSLLESMRAALLADPAIQAAGVSASIGAVTHHPSGPDLATLMKRADQLMYRVKAEGRDAVHVARVDDLASPG
jgi:diguanylate cyclase (GGDEF)-like protein